jgi:hypothetical protein
VCAALIKNTTYSSTTRIYRNYVTLTPIEIFNTKLYSTKIDNINQRINDPWVDNFIKANALGEEILIHCENINDLVGKISTILKVTPLALKYEEFQRFALFGGTQPITNKIDNYNENDDEITLRAKL